MQELLVLSNPKRRRKSRKARRASRKSRRKMSALQMQFFGKRRRGGKRRARRSHAVAVPMSRRSRRSSRRGFRLGLSGSGGSLASPMSLIGPALTGAIGAAAVNTIGSQLAVRLPIPALFVGPVRYVTNGALAIGLGMLASRFGLGAGVAAKMAEGSLTVTLHQALVEAAGRAGVSLGGFGFYMPGRIPAAVPPSAGSASRQVAGMGKYVTGPGATGSVVPMRRGSMGNINTFKF